MLVLGIDVHVLQDLDNYIKTRAPVTFLQDLRVHLTVRIYRVASWPHKAMVLLPVNLVTNTMCPTGVQWTW
jgi:hypothetical protein